MIQSGSVLSVVDNSGARKVRCINVLKGYKKRYAFIGDVITVSVIRLRRTRRKYSKVLKGDVMKAVIVRDKKGISSFSNSSLKFNENSVVLLGKKKFLGTRVFGGIPKFFRYTRYLKAVALSAGPIK